MKSELTALIALPFVFLFFVLSIPFYAFRKTKVQDWQ